MRAFSIWEQEGSIARALWQNGKADFPIYDMHGHMGENYAIYLARCEADDMVHHMKRIGVKRLCFSHNISLFNMDGIRGKSGNEHAVESCRRHPDILRMYLGINPNYPEQMRKDLANFDNWRPFAIGLKFLPSYHLTKATDPAYGYALDFAEERGIPVLYHTWGNSVHNNGPEMLAVTSRYSRIKFFLGHSIFGDWDSAERCVKEGNGNVYLELTAIPGERGIIEELVRRVGSERILYGTDMPWFDEYQAVGGVVSAKITEEDMKNILYRNAERILGEEW